MVESPFYRFYRRADFPLPWAVWKRLPRLPSFKNEYWDGSVHLTPRPKTCDLFLPLDERHGATSSKILPRSDPPLIQLLKDEDWADLPDVFHWSFARLPPLYSWSDPAATRAARCIMRWTQLGRDGTLIRKACFTAGHAQDSDEGASKLCGAAIVTLVPHRRLRDVPPEYAVPHPERHEERVVPHLCWIFVLPRLQRHGIATRLLHAVVDALRAMGFGALASTCLMDNTASLLWHWRNGFQVPPDSLAPLL